MKNRVKVDDNNLFKIINEYTSENEESSDQNYENDKYKKNYSKYNIISYVCNGIFVVLIIVLLGCLFERNDRITHLQESIYYLSDDIIEYEDKSRKLDNLLGNFTYSYINDKLSFLDDNIVFVIDGYGDFYYNYDCLMNNFPDNVRYYAFNVRFAEGIGYREGICDYY